MEDDEWMPIECINDSQWNKPYSSNNFKCDFVEKYWVTYVYFDRY